MNLHSVNKYSSRVVHAYNPSTWRLRKKKDGVFVVSLNYTASVRLAWASERENRSQKQKQNKNNPRKVIISLLVFSPALVMIL